MNESVDLFHHSSTVAYKRIPQQPTSKERKPTSQFNFQRNQDLSRTYF